MRHRLLLIALCYSCVGTRYLGAEAVPKNREQMAEEYLGFLDQGRTPARGIRFAIDHSPGFRVVDPGSSPAGEILPGDRLLLVEDDRTAIVVVVGTRPIASAGARLIGAHIDTPAPRIDTAGLSKEGQKNLKAYRYGGIKLVHWLWRPLAIVGEVVAADGRSVSVELGLDDDFAFVATAKSDGVLTVVTSSTPVDQKKAPSQSLVTELHRRHDLDARDLEAAELYLVPREGPRFIGADRQFIGSHGQDDRANTYAAWRAVTAIEGTPEITAIAWLVDREEVGSTGKTGARSRFLEMAYGYLMRGQGVERITEARLLRAFAASQAISADTPACLNPNWPEVHEKRHAPLLGSGPAMFPFTGRGGKMGGSGAHAPFIHQVLSAFASARVPLQKAELGRVDEGGGGTIAKYLAERGMDAVDVGICVVSMHSPFEVSSTADLWAAYRGFVSWFSMSIVEEK